ncbi:MAG: GPGG-motif small membrane protein [Acidimicrobiales bacterium]
MYLLLWLLAAVLVIGGITNLVRGQMLYGIGLILVGLLVGPGGASVFAA